MARKKAGPFPSRDEVVRFIAESPTPLTKRDLVRAFQIQVEDRPRFKDLLREIEAAGEVDRGRGRRLAKPEALPSVTVVRVRSVDLDGEATAFPDRWEEADGPPPRIFIAPESRPGAALSAGQRALVRLRQQPDGSYAGKVLKALD
ncbi:MAG: ribonuclease R, partial [Rhodospirillaceae bacterium]|nr:ribonuclease R [Rhodospirillaceae bacterium]